MLVMVGSLASVGHMRELSLNPRKCKIFNSKYCTKEKYMYFSKKQKVKLPIRMAFYYDANITVINIQLQYYTVIDNY